MSNEQDIRRLLKMRTDLEERAERLREEIDDINTAMAEIDRMIVGVGFRQPSAFQPMKPAEAKPVAKVEAPKPQKAPEAVTDGSSIQAKDGTILGRVQLTDDTIQFTPREGLSFTISTPPFQSFLLDRVLANMKTTDEARAATGEITPEQVLSFNVDLDGETIRGLLIRNFGGERRLREIQSSLRWSLDKMYDKMRRG